MYARMALVCVLLINDSRLITWWSVIVYGKPVMSSALSIIQSGRRTKSRPFLQRISPFNPIRKLSESIAISSSLERKAKKVCRSCAGKSRITTLPASNSTEQFKVSGAPLVQSMVQLPILIVLLIAAAGQTPERSWNRRESATSCNNKKKYYWSGWNAAVLHIRKKTPRSQRSPRFLLQQLHRECFRTRRP